MKENRNMAEKNQVTDNQFQKIVNKVSLITIILNALLSVFKLFAGIFAHSTAMISDAVHSASDVFSTIIVIIGVGISTRDADREHPYGHERMECVAAILLSTVLFFTGLGIGIQALGDIMQGNYESLEMPGILALIAAVVSIVTKEGMYWYTRYYAKKNRFIRVDGGCMASPFGCFFFYWRTDWHRRFKIGFPCHGRGSQPGHFCVYCKSCF